MGRGCEMRITFMAALIVIVGVLLLAVLLDKIGREPNEQAKGL
jgi:hypothetical protein